MIGDVVDVLACEALHADDALALAVEHDRHTEIGQRLLAQNGRAKLLAPPADVGVDDERFASFDDLAGQALAVGHRLEIVTVLEAEVDDSPLPIEERDIRDVGLEDGGDLLADEVDEGVDVELAGQLL